MASIPSEDLSAEDQLTVEIGGIPIARITEQELIARVLTSLDNSIGGRILTVNLDILRIIDRDEKARRAISGVSYAVADGMPIVWLTQLLGNRLPDRITGSNLFHSLTKAGAMTGKRVFLLGGDYGVAKEAARRLGQENEGIQITGYYFPPFGFDNDIKELEKISARLLSAKPDIVYVGLGFPKQEFFIDRFCEILPQTWWIGVGISFSFAAQKVRRAPIWVQRIGFEWAHRLIQEPRRLARRYLLEDLPFGVRLFWHTLRTRNAS